MHNLSCENEFYLHMRMKNHFHIKGWTLVLIQRPGGTRKSRAMPPIRAGWKRSIVMTFLWSGTGHGLVHRPMKGNTGYYCFQNLDFLGLEILNSAQGIRNPSSTDKESVSHSVKYRLMACLGLTGSMSIHAATECTPDFPSGLFPA